ncbi:TetR/AcrR family transcriptional regulator [Chitinimonas lacunae]|uniref:TetR/AcrR family transcriptional regulator n=1 Tax=Chitinimonas lacunae TaxID=1963018 RepID=A0ABV8MJA0_9NEIS
MKTYDRIVQESLKLFNEHGERSITTNHIAAHLGISPGNLYYHFRNKEEIVYRIFLQYRDYMRDNLQVPSDRAIVAEDLGRYLETAFAAMWQYRFLFYDMPGLLARNPKMQEAYHDFVRTDMTVILGRQFAEFVAIGMVDIPLTDLQPLATNVWMLVKFWFAFQQSIHPHTPITETTGRSGVRQVLSLLKPYIQPSFRERFEALEQGYAVHTPV